MKRATILLVFCAIFIQSNAQFSPAEVANRATHTQIELDQATVSVYYQFTQQAMQGRTPVFLTDTTVLRIGRIYSVYYNRSSILRDSVFSATTRYMTASGRVREVRVIGDAGELDEILRNMHSGIVNTQNERRISTRFFKNRQTHTITSVDGSSEMFLVEETIPPMEWEIFPDTMTVLNYLCFKATTTFRGRNYIAWFTMDIPINEGPWKIYGLPGLILRLEDEDGLFVHEAVGLVSHTERPITMSGNAYTRITNEQLQRWIENRTIVTNVVSNGVFYVGGSVRSTLTFHRREIGD